MLICIATVPVAAEQSRKQAAEDTAVAAAAFAVLLGLLLLLLGLLLGLLALASCKPAVLLPLLVLGMAGVVLLQEACTHVGAAGLPVREAVALCFAAAALFGH